MEQKFTNGRKNAPVPKKGSGNFESTSNFDELFGSFEDPFEEIDISFADAKTSLEAGRNSLLKAQNGMAASQQRFDAMMRAEMERMDHIFKDVQESVQKDMSQAKQRLEDARQNMKFQEYTDSDGYHVQEGVSKDGMRVLMKMRNLGGKFESKIEMYKGDVLTFSSNETTYSYRDSNGKTVTVLKRPVARRVEATYTSERSTVKKNIRKKKSHGGIWILLGIAVVVLYFVFLR